MNTEVQFEWTGANGGMASGAAPTAFETVTIARYSYKEWLDRTTTIPDTKEPDILQPLTLT